MLRSTRMWGLGVFLFVIVPVVLAIYGMVSGTVFFATQGRDIAVLIIIAMAAMSVYCFNAAAKIDASPAQKKEAAAEEQRRTEATSKKGFAH